MLHVHLYSVVAGPVTWQYVHGTPDLNLLTLIFSWRILLVCITLKTEHIPDINIQPPERTRILFPNDPSIFRSVTSESLSMGAIDVFWTVTTWGCSWNVFVILSSEANTNNRFHLWGDRTCSGISSCKCLNPLENQSTENYFKTV